MIISASRRTDIPAFYSKWLLNRLKAGYVYVKNPLNSGQISQVSLHPDVVDCIVFWTKNAAPMLDKLNCIDDMGYKYYFQWTITPYGRDIEPNLPDKGKIIDSFKSLSDSIGKKRIVWRYDPVIVSPQFSIEYHTRHFARMCALLCGYTDKCIFSYIDLYTKIKKNMKQITEYEIDTTTKEIIAGKFAEIARSYGINLETCAEQIDLSRFEIKHASCIDQVTMEGITGYPLTVSQDKNQRPFCQCIESIDIGAYDCCAHGCIYCYANSRANTITGNIKKHNSHAPLLLDNLCPSDKITVRTVKSLRNRRISLYNE